MTPERGGAQGALYSLWPVGGFYDFGAEFPCVFCAKRPPQAPESPFFLPMKICFAFL